MTVLNDQVTSILRAAGQITTGLGLIAFLAALFFMLVSRRKEQSLRESLIGSGVVRPDVVLKILEKFKTEDGRLRALKGVLQHDAQSALAIVKKTAAIEPTVATIGAEHARSRTFVLSGVVLVLLGLLGVLFGNGRGTPPQTQDSGGGSPETRRAPTGKVKLRMAITEENWKTINAAAKSYAGALENLDLEIDHLGYDKLYRDGTPDNYDILMLDDIWVPERAAALVRLDQSPDVLGAIGQKTSSMREWFAHTYISAATQVAYSGPDLVALPMIGNVELLIYHDNLIPVGLATQLDPPQRDRAGAPEPFKGRYDTLLSSILASYTSPRWKGLPFALRGGDPNDLVEIFWQLLRGYGYDDDAGVTPLAPDGSLVIDRCASQKALFWLRSLFHRGAHPQSRKWSTEATTTAMTVSPITAGMAIAWPYWFWTAERSTEVPNKEHLQVARLSEHPIMGLWMIAVSAKSEHKPEALELILKLTTDPAIQYTLAKEGAVPVVRELADEGDLDRYAFWKNNHLKIEDALEDAKPRPRTARWREIELSLGKWLRRAIDNDRELKDAAPDFRFVGSACNTVAASQMRP